MMRWLWIVNDSYTPVVCPRKSVVDVFFAARNMTCSYYNDQFDLKRGDIVFVDGKLEGLKGRVVEVNYNFKIKLSEYKRVIAVVDTSVEGELFFAGSHMISFECGVIPAGKIAKWFLPPRKEEDEIVCGSDDFEFYLDHLDTMNVEAAVFERGKNYFLANKVRYINLGGRTGYAIVEGSKPYEVEFEYQDGKIKNLTCTCYCNYHCKHEVAAMLELRALLDLIEENYKEQFTETEYFAAIDTASLLMHAVGGKKHGSVSFHRG